MDTSTYERFIAAKYEFVRFPGIEAGRLPDTMFPHQKDLTRWALRKGRAALFAATGLGKSIMSLAWATEVAHRGRVLLLTPLAVAQQFVGEGRKFGMPCRYLRADDGQPGIIVTNYEMLDRFDVSTFIGVVLDESSILKSFDGKTRNQIIQAFQDTPYRLAATATPAPNDFAELGNHSEFLGVKTRAEMLAEYFVHDGETTQEWRLKGHAQDAFWRWVASWGAIIQLPSDLGYDDGAYALPPIRMIEHVIPVDVEDAHRAGQLFATETRTLSDQRANRKATMSKRAQKAAEIASEPGPCIVWAELNAEADASEAAISDAIQVSGSNSLDEKVDRLNAFVEGRARVLVGKASICGFGMNFQHCHRMVFLGASHSFEQTFQAIRRCWRFGQTRPVEVHIIRAENEGAIMANYRRKEADNARMAQEMREHSRAAVRMEVQGVSGREWNPYDANMSMIIPTWIRKDGHIA